MRDSLNGLTMADDSLLLYDTYSVVRFLHRFPVYIFLTFLGSAPLEELSRNFPFSFIF